ncbi:MAG: hypothetical protein CM1200mP10_07400 [Candidatus Neomarinimicrobiota bacterium]|nr:MAG: hypothetical protein CM1200mP10_07400 [Candidatus Neomarinimicrobiota bacterium]
MEKELKIPLLSETVELPEGTPTIPSFSQQDYMAGFLLIKGKISRWLLIIFQI